MPRPRFRMAWLLGMVAAIAVGLGTWKDRTSPVRAWREEVFGSGRTQGRAVDNYRARRWPGLSRADAASGLLEAVDSPDPEVRAGAIRFLPEFATARPGIVERLVSLSGAPDSPESIRSGAVDAMGRLPKEVADSRAVVDALVAASGDPAVTPRIAAGWSLGEVGKSTGTLDERMIAALIRLAADPDSMVRANAIRSLARNGRGLEYLPALKDRLEALPTSDYREKAALREALAELCGRSDEAIPVLIREVFRDGSNFQVLGLLKHVVNRDAARRVRIKDQVVAALTSDDPEARVVAAFALVAIGEDRLAAGELGRAVERPDRMTRLRAIETLSRIGPIDPSSVEALRRAAASGPDELTRANAARTLSSFAGRWLSGPDSIK